MAATAAFSATTTTPQRWLQRGLARLTATADASGKTRLTQVSHQAPMRLVPIPSSRIQQAGAAVCALSSYGGGMLPGDVHKVHVNVQTNATLGLVTQGPQRIYKRSPKNHGLSCRSVLFANVASDALFVYGMDPCVPFRHSSFQQQVNVSLELNASVILVDWFGAGRLSRGEFWDFDSISSKTTLCKNEDDFPFLIESMHLNNDILSTDEDSFGFQNQWNAYCSVILHGPQAEPVARRLQQLSLQLASKCTRVRDFESTSSISIQPPLTSGRVLLGICEIDSSQKDDDGPTYLARLATTCNEDMYRLLHTSMQPLASKFGFEFYRDRIHASQTSDTAVVSSRKETENRKQTRRQYRNHESTPTLSPKLINTSPAFSWSAYMLADSVLPTGSFAHSAGIEAAAQLGLLPNKTLLQDYVRAAVRSSLQLQVPFVVTSQETVYTVTDWKMLDRQMHAYMVSNSVACRASLEQGQGLLRVALSLLQDQNDNTNTVDKNQSKYIALLKGIQESTVLGEYHGHLAPIFGIVCSSLGLSSSEESCQLLGYCTARDMVSAAVRLNLIGPMAGVSLLDTCMDAVEEGIASGKQLMHSNDEEDEYSWMDSNIVQAATCAPIAETIHPCHEVLSVRLFRT